MSQQKDDNEFGRRYTMRRQSLDELLGRAHASLEREGFAWEAQQLSMIRTLVMGQWPDGEPPTPGEFDKDPEI